MHCGAHCNGIGFCSILLDSVEFSLVFRLSKVQLPEFGQDRESCNVIFVVEADRTSQKFRGILFDYPSCLVLYTWANFVNSPHFWSIRCHWLGRLSIVSTLPNAAMQGPNTITSKHH